MADPRSHRTLNPVGQLALLEALGLSLPEPYTRSYVSAGARLTAERPDRTEPTDDILESIRRFCLPYLSVASSQRSSESDHQVYKAAGQASKHNTVCSCGLCRAQKYRDRPRRRHWEQ